MIDLFDPKQEGSIGQSIREAADSRTTVPPDLYARIRLAVHAEAAQEPIRHRRSWFFKAGLTFAFACLIGFLIQGRIGRRYGGLSEMEPDIFKSDMRWSQQEGRLPNGATRSALTAAAVRSPAQRQLARDYERASIEPQTSDRAAPRSSPWRREQWQVYEVPVSAETPPSPPPSSMIRMSVTDASEQEIRSLQMTREPREGDVASAIEYQARPVLTGLE